MSLVSAQSWRPLKAKQAGEVGYHLFTHAAPKANPAA